MIDLVLRKVFGSKHERDVKRMRPRVAAINELEKEIGGWPDEAFRRRADELRQQIQDAIRAGRDGDMADLARLAVAALGGQGETSGVIGVDVQRIRRTLDLRQQAGQEPGEAELDRDNIRRFEAHLRRELERALIHRTESLPPAKPLAEYDRALPGGRCRIWRRSTASSRS